jgi:hypothetical protein
MANHRRVTEEIIRNRFEKISQGYCTNSKINIMGITKNIDTINDINELKGILFLNLFNCKCFIEFYLIFILILIYLNLL